MLNPSSIELSLETASDGNRLSWASVDSQSVERFEIERATDALQFQSLAVVSYQAAQAAAGFLFYDSTQLKQATQKVYYRIKQVLQDSSVSYSNLTSALVPDLIQVSIYPNPSSEYAHLQVEHPLQQALSVSILNTVGQQVWQSHVSPSESSIPIDVEHWQEGTYVVHAWNEQHAQTLHFQVR